ncbi:hypothetical protein GV828_06350 [Flavobacterium sp. NST-5]|uniref:Glycosyltransferase RgtA/B/C/D-like domain-containing protein n=1 Tax=Flavobacterium ichthyis TaxID=2698827 RepID=A0ABW9ZAM5_9FLAO|nr:hypothetical protein [Flavobacterium ichthyis]NBL64819.1 hypothetical protein [Flavobacterium ichthyis]
MINDNYGHSYQEIFMNGALLNGYIGSVIYSIVGREPMIWGFVYLILGLCTIFNIHRAVYIITQNYKFANRAAWVAGLFPNMAIMSVIILREQPIHFFISLSLLYFIKYLKNKNALNFTVFLLTGAVASIFHSAVFALFLGAILYLTIFAKKIGVFSKVLVVSLAIGGLFFINTTGIGLSKFGGSFESAIEIASDGGGAMKEDAGSNYPDWLVLKGSITDLALIPVRIIAFLFAPLIPFLVRSGGQAIGLIDALFYLVLFFNIFKNKLIHEKSDAAKFLFVTIFIMAFAFSFGASNFGTNIRHRAKLLPIILMIPLITAKERKSIVKFQQLK